MSDSTTESGLDASQQGGATTMTEAPPIVQRTKTKTDRLPPWSVLLHNDDFNDMIDVKLTADFAQLGVAIFKPKR